MAAGNATAVATTLETLWKQYHREVVRFLRQSCGDPDLAADLAVETFLAASRSIDAGKEITACWLKTVARRRLMDHWRRTYRQKDVMRAYQLAYRSGDSGDPADMVGHGVTAALESLCWSQRCALTLRYIDDCTVPQVAARLGLGYQATESLLARGRRSLARAVIRQDEAELAEAS